MKFVIGGIVVLLAAHHALSRLGLNLFVVEHSWRPDDRRFRFPVRHGFIAADWRDWLIFESDFGNDGSDTAPYLFDIFAHRLDWSDVLHYGAFDRRHRLHRLFEWRHYVTGFEDGIPGWLDSKGTADCDSGWAPLLRRWSWDQFFWCSTIRLRFTCRGLALKRLSKRRAGLKQDEFIARLFRSNQTVNAW